MENLLSRVDKISIILTNSSTLKPLEKVIVMVYSVSMIYGLGSGSGRNERGRCAAVFFSQDISIFVCLSTDDTHSSLPPGTRRGSSKISFLDLYMCKL